MVGSNNAVKTFEADPLDAGSKRSRGGLGTKIVGICDAAEFRAAVHAMGAIPVVPSRRGAKQPQPCPA